MQMYPNYLMNNNQQYQQQGYVNGYPQMQQIGNPYMDQLSQLRAMQNIPVQTQTINQGIIGRMVDDFNVITANDVPMDGNGAIFVKRDGSEIQVRNWNANGTIATSVFKPVQMEQTKDMSKGMENNAVRLSDDVIAMLQKNFEDINKRFDELEKSILPLD